MKQKISGIFILLSFLGMLSHSLVPHRHHSIQIAGHDQVFHEKEAGIDTSNHAEHINSVCAMHEHDPEDHHVECPHHLHNCSLIISGIALPGNVSKLINQISYCRLTSPDDLRQVNFTEENSTIGLISEQFFYTGTYLLSSLGLRAPPSQA